MPESLVFSARGFGPGLPPAGAEIQARLVGDVLHVDAWPQAGRSIRTSQITVLRQAGGQVLLEWDTPGGRCGLSIAKKIGAGDTAAELLRRLPSARNAKPRGDGGTRAWLWAALLFALGVPLLLLGLFFAFRGELLDAVVARIPVAQEQRLGDQLWALQARQLKLIEGNAANQVVADIGARLVAATPTPYTYRFHLVDDPSINAFAMPAGYIVVHRGLIARAASAEELAGVLAHEIEHVEGRHSLRGMLQALGLSALWMAVSGDVGGGLAAEWIRHLAAMQFSRQQEEAADSGGYARLLQAGIDPRGMASFFDRLAGAAGEPPQALSLLSTHPASSERSARLKQLLSTAPVLPPLAYDWPATQAALKPLP
jgi:Zn-dependent protease with chaperone function